MKDQVDIDIFRDLYNAIASGDFPTWTMFIQVMTFKQAEHWEFNPFDLTKVKSEKIFFRNARDSQRQMCF